MYGYSIVSRVRVEAQHTSVAQAKRNAMSQPRKQLFASLVGMAGSSSAAQAGWRQGTWSDVRAEAPQGKVQVQSKGKLGSRVQQVLIRACREQGELRLGRKRWWA
jgi:hypothetical protein